MQKTNRDWKNYNTSLVNRGSINFWLDEEALSKWTAKQTGKSGRPFQCSDEAITFFATVRYLFKLPLRATEGFLKSLFSPLDLLLIVPGYSGVCKSMQKITLPTHLKKGVRITDIVLDSTGLKVYGEGEWKRKKHGIGGKRTWRKLHLAINAENQEIVFSKITREYKPDTTYIPEIIQGRKGMKRFLIDGVGDKSWLYKMFSEKNICFVTPPQRNAKLRKESWLAERNKAILAIKTLGNDAVARTIWSKFSGYNKRVTVESAIARWKRLFGPALQSRNQQNQDLEIALKSSILNKMKVA